MLVHHFFEKTAQREPHKIALICEGRSYTYAEINEAAKRLGASMLRRGVDRNDRVAIFMDNSVEAVVAIYAALKIGAIFMPINALTKADKLAYILNDAEATCLVTHAARRSEWQPVLDRSATVHTCVVVGEESGGALRDERLMRYNDAVMGAQSDNQESQAIDQDLASILYTSGSTGDPKGVMLTHLNMISASNSVLEYLKFRSDDVILCIMSLAYGYGLYHVLMGFQVGATVVLERSLAFPVKTLELMAHHHVTVLPGTPTIFSMLLNVKTVSKYDLRALRLITNAAAALSQEHLRRLRETFPRAVFFSMYGLTECKRVTYLPPDQLDIRPTSVGRGMPNQECWLVDDHGKRLPNGSTGELVIRGSHVMRGYWRKPEETAKRLKPGPNPGEWVLHSGDLFRTDEEGYLYFVARKDDIIKSRGEKISPVEVENALYRLDGVLEAAVVGVPDPVLGQAIKAFLVLKAGYSYSEKDVVRHCLAKLENFMAPKYVVFMESLPKTDNGKIKKMALT